MTEIVGTGIDLIEVERVKAALERPATGARFRARVFTEREIAYCESRGRGRFQSYAARFAAKEAAMKALGTGRSQGVLWREIEVVRHGGPPQLRFHGTAAARFASLGATRALLSLTHAESLALAQVLFLS